MLQQFSLGDSNVVQSKRKAWLQFVICNIAMSIQQTWQNKVLHFCTICNLYTSNKNVTNSLQRVVMENTVFIPESTTSAATFRHSPAVFELRSHPGEPNPLDAGWLLLGPGRQATCPKSSTKIQRTEPAGWFCYFLYCVIMFCYVLLLFKVVFHESGRKSLLQPIQLTLLLFHQGLMLLHLHSSPTQDIFAHGRSTVNRHQ